MVPLTNDDLDGVSEAEKYPDGTVVRVFCMRTDRDAYPSGWAYKFHYGTTDPDPSQTLRTGRSVDMTTHTKTRKVTNCTSRRIPSRSKSGFRE